MYCKHCAKEIDDDVIVCPHCGKQVQDLNENKVDRNIIINNSSSASAAASASATASGASAPYGKRCDKTTALLLCIFLGIFGGHKFYEGKPGMGILYLFTGGLFFIGWIIDIFVILGKPNPYYV